MNIHTIVIDGGPCAGKTTVMSFLQQKLADFGHHVIVVNEHATELITAGLGPDVLGGKYFQEVLLQGIIEKEDRYKMRHNRHFWDISSLNSFRLQYNTGVQKNGVNHLLFQWK